MKETVFGDHPPVYTPATLADRWQCWQKHIRTMIESGELRAFRIGKLVRVQGAEVERYENSSPPSPPPEPEPPAVTMKAERAKRLDTLSVRARLRTLRDDR